MKRTGPTNPDLGNVIAELRQKAIVDGVSLWSRIASDLNKPTRIRRTVNIYKIDKHVKDGETVVVPGKVLAVGDLSRNVTVAAFAFSKDAIKKINKKGKALTIVDWLKQNPKPQQVRIIG